MHVKLWRINLEFGFDLVCEACFDLIWLLNVELDAKRDMMEVGHRGHLYTLAFSKNEFVILCISL